MTDYLLDTNHAGELFKNRGKFPSPVRNNGTISRLLLCYPGVGELWYMVYKSSRQLENIQLLRAFLSSYEILHFDARAAEDFGAIYTQLMSAGKRVKVIDMQIAAIARTNGLIVLTTDKHFSYISGVTCENWLK